MVAKLRPINAANPCKNTCSVDLLIVLKAKPAISMATNGAKITTHFIAPVKKKASNVVLVPTMKLTIMLVNTAKAI
jgi:hypothetical protein